MMKLVFLPLNRINLVKTKIIIKAYYQKELSYSAISYYAGMPWQPIMLHCCYRGRNHN